MQKLEINGGQVIEENGYLLQLPPLLERYGDAQIDDYAGLARRHYPWRPGVRMQLRARFSHPAAELQGTAGFGFWNAPFGDPTVPWPALPQAVWFFYASEPNDLPLAPLTPTGEMRPGRGWFAATLDATTTTAVSLIPAAPVVILGNQLRSFRRWVWPAVQRKLGISYQQLKPSLTDWHDYELVWSAAGCEFWVDGESVLQTEASPRGPLGFVCWLDNQYMVVTPTGRFRWGVLKTTETQWLALENLQISTI